MKIAPVLVAGALIIAGCGGDDDTTAGGTSPGAAKFEACMVSDSGGIDDRSFNATSWKGLQDAQKEFGIKASYVESTAETDFVPNINSQVAKDCGIIVTVGFLLGDATADAAKANPNEKFAIVDFSYEEPIPNVKPLVFNTAEAAFLAGYVAAGMTQSGTVATYGGIKIPTVTIFMDGFVDGVAYYNQQNSTSAKVLGWDKAKQDGSFTGDFTDQSKGRTLTEGFIDQGADIILPVAGPVGLGSAAAAQESGGKVNVIWVDTDGYESASQYRTVFLTSVVKRMDNAVKAATKEALDGKFTNTAYVGTLQNDGVGIAPFHDFDSKVPQKLKDGVEKLKQDIISGAVKVESPSSPK
jgi:basic membrane protein A